MSDIIKKITSRKFLLSIASMLASIGTSIAGLQSGNQAITIVGVVCTVASAAIYAGCEAYVDASAVLKSAAEIAASVTNTEDTTIGAVDESEVEE